MKLTYHLKRSYLIDNVTYVENHNFTLEIPLVIKHPYTVLVFKNLRLLAIFFCERQLNNRIKSCRNDWRDRRRKTSTRLSLRSATSQDSNRDVTSGKLSQKSNRRQNGQLAGKQSISKRTFRSVSRTNRRSGGRAQSSSGPT